MLFFYVRHGDPIYSPDSLTELGHKQAEALTDRFARFGLDKIYSSSSERAVMTATPTAKALGKEIVKLDFAQESLAYHDFSVVKPDGKKCWCFQDVPTKMLFVTPEMTALGKKWYDSPAFEGRNYGKAYERITTAADEFFASLGYVHEPENNRFRAVNPTNDRVALFAHQGFGLLFLSHVLDIPFPMFCTHFNTCHSGVSVIYFNDQGGYTVPKVLELSNDSHLYRAGLPLAYNNFETLQF